MIDRLLTRNKDSARAWVGVKAPSRGEGRALSGVSAGRDLTVRGEAT